MKRTEIAPILAIVPCLALVACAEQAEQEETPAMEMSATVDTQALAATMDEMEAAWETAYEAGDATTLASLYAQDAVYMPPYMDAIQGRAAIEARFTETMGMTSGQQITIERTDFGASGDLAYGIGTYAVEMQMGDAAEPVAENGKYVTISKRGEDGSWRIYAHIWNTSLSEAEVAEMLSSMNM